MQALYNVCFVRIWKITFGSMLHSKLHLLLHSCNVIHCVYYKRRRAIISHFHITASHFHGIKIVYKRIHSNKSYLRGSIVLLSYDFYLPTLEISVIHNIMMLNPEAMNFICRHSKYLEYKYLKYNKNMNSYYL